MRKLPIILLLLLFCGCTKKVYVPQYHEHTSYITDSVLLHDTTLQRDSVVIKVQGDTIYNDRWHYRDRLQYKYVIHHDTITQRDSIAYPVEVIKVKEVNKLHWWQRWLIWFGGIVAVGGAIYGGIKLMPLIKKVV
jgi:hypothetical protein